MAPPEHSDSGSDAWIILVVIVGMSIAWLPGLVAVLNMIFGWR